MDKNFRYKIAPQMKTYDNLGFRWLPFLMFNQTVNFRSNILNTDNRGYRYSLNYDLHPESIFQRNNDKQNIIILGGSYGFGVGSTRDDNTIAGYLEKFNKDYNFLNLSSRAHVGFQEILSLLLNINEIKNVKKIIIISGLNDIHLSKFFDKAFPDSPYYKSLFLEKMEESQLTFKKKIFQKIFNLFSTKNLRFETIKQINKKNFFTFLFSRKFRENLMNDKIDSISFEQKLDRNIKLYKLLGDNFKCEVDFYFQPVNNWCKDKSTQEKQIQEFSKKYSKKINHYLDEVYNKESYEKYLNLYRKFTKKNNINFYDLNDYFKKNSSRNDWLFVDGIHCNDNGYKLAAKFISE